MLDETTTLESIKQKIRAFGDARDWGQYHTPKNLSMGLAGEAAELLEIFLWVDSQTSKAELDIKRKEVEHELADVALYVLQFCARYNIDLAKAIDEKMKLNEEKYPLSKAKGRWEKYTKL